MPFFIFSLYYLLFIHFQRQLVHDYYHSDAIDRWRDKGQPRWRADFGSLGFIKYIQQLYERTKVRP